jgi:hypothetical protein
VAGEPDLLDPGAASVAGAAHGQLASPMAGGGLALSGHKLVDEGARALLLHVPGLVRIDVCPLDDGLQVIPRVLCDVELGWEVDEEVVTDYGKTAEETQQPALVRFRLALWTEPYPIGGRVLLSFTRTRAHGPSHFVGHALLVEMRPDG